MRHSCTGTSSALSEASPLPLARPALLLLLQVLPLLLLRQLLLRQLLLRQLLLLLRHFLLRQVRLQARRS